MSGLGWAELEKPIGAGDPAGVVAVLAGVDEVDRRALAKLLVERRKLPWRLMGPDWWERLNRESAALLVAGAGCQPGVARVVSWLASGRRFPRPQPGPDTDRLPELVVEVLRERGQPAMDKVAAGLADRLRGTGTGAGDWELVFDWRLVAALVDASGAAVPTTDGFVLGWLAARPYRSMGRGNPRLPVEVGGGGRPALVDLLRADPYLEALLPRIMEVDGTGQRLGDGWRYALVGLAAEGRAPRETLLDGCLYRLRAGDRVGALRRVAELHRELAPTLDELAGHRAQYVDLMASPQAFVATLAQQALRTLHDAGRLPLDDLLAASAAALLRGEKGLVRGQLAWLDKVAAGTDPPDEVLATVAVALSHDRIDLAERALKLLSRHLPRAGDAGRQAVRAAADHLTGDLRHQASALPGIDLTDRTDLTAPTDLTDPAGPTDPAALTDPASPTDTGGLAHPADLSDPAGVAGAGGLGWPAGAGVAGEAGTGMEEMPPGIGSVAELVAEVAAMLRNAPDPVRVERVMAGLVRWAVRDRSALAAAVEPLLPEWFGGHSGAAVELLRAAVGLPARDRPSGRRYRMPDDVASPFDRTVIGRLEELTGQLRAGPPPELLATPAWTTGHVDPERLLAALVRAEREGWEPGRYDVGQALLRLPRELDPAIRDRAAGLRLRAGRQLARWLELGGLPDPAVTLVRAVPDTRSYRRDRPAYRLATAYQLDAGAGERATQLGLPGWLGSLPVPEATVRAFRYHWAPGLAAWPWVLPSHREIVAAYVLPTVAPGGDEDSSDTTGVLPGLARCHGPFGPGLALALGYALAARRERDRLPAVDAALALVAAGDWDGALLGRLIAPLVVDRVLTLGRLVAALTELARAGAARAVWPVTATLLTGLLPTDSRPPGTSDLLTLATTTAPAAVGALDVGTAPGGAVRGGFTGDDRAALVAVLGPVAERGSGRLGTEARRLRRTLAG